jgi:hypothetical protein
MELPQLKSTALTKADAQVKMRRSRHKTRESKPRRTALSFTAELLPLHKIKKKSFDFLPSE